MRLNEAAQDRHYVVEKIEGKGPVKRRIMDMGITRHTEIYVRKFAPLGDPIQVTVRGYELSLRKADAALIVVREEEAKA
ncbi:ferrous iron transport protein A [Aedoeadaptatus ivorii]|uniref:Ferrous iron transport protein A n=1 Tax=Aedoeadaptatus ivorii TaxID=54006 RepID=A0A3S4YLD0_9FIRM|nr:ferrous iron transport protein A [Peptoniphilus ivorii]MDQ0508862.1 ferrous iron transport protein A [Peptoniphilus ivorii]VEJ36018.1 ferrous iron transport protein A [Peptoniphilus ivorii]